MAEQGWQNWFGGWLTTWWEHPWSTPGASVPTIGPAAPPLEPIQWTGVTNTGLTWSGP